MPTLKSIAVLCYQNEDVAKATATGIIFSLSKSEVILKEFFPLSYFVHLKKNPFVSRFILIQA